MRKFVKLPKDWFYCLNCGKAAKANPKYKQGPQKFCTAVCRKEFWKHGGVSVHRLKLSVQGWIREYLAEHLPAMVKETILIKRKELVDESAERIARRERDKTP